MNQIIINGGSLRYLSELPQFKNGLPDGIINKTKPDVGGTYIAANCDKNYIIVCPFKDLVDSIAADTNNKYEVFKCYGGIYEADWRKYENNHKIKKIAVTYDSFSKKLIKWINPKDYYVVVDEYHLLLSEMDYREDAINGLIALELKLSLCNTIYAAGIYLLVSFIWCNVPELPTNAYRILKI